MSDARLWHPSRAITGTLRERPEPPQPAVEPRRAHLLCATRDLHRHHADARDDERTLSQDDWFLASHAEAATLIESGDAAAVTDASGIFVATDGAWLVLDDGAARTRFRRGDVAPATDAQLEQLREALAPTIPKRATQTRCGRARK